MPDGTRKRRFSPVSAQRQWYARHRAERFRRRFGWPQEHLKPHRSILGGRQMP